MLPYLKGQEVFGYVDGTIKAPPATLTVNGTSTPNPEFALWTKKDNLILSTINSSLTEEGHLFATDYFVQIKKLYLWLARHSRLGPEYDPLVNTIVGRESITLEELYSMLLTTEARILHNNQPLSALFVASANVAARSFDPPRGRVAVFLMVL
ncbi:hypothetical protein ABFS83_11G082800 [Erythranthe nasuta]